jgi:hypothetical protein
MGEATKPQLIIDGVEYDTDSLDSKQRVLLDHVLDLEKKINAAKFSLDQLTIGRDAFINMLNNSLVAASKAE